MKEAEAEGAEEGMAVAEEGWVADQGVAAAAAAVAVAVDEECLDALNIVVCTTCNSFCKF